VSWYVEKRSQQKIADISPAYTSHPICSNYLSEVQLKSTTQSPTDPTTILEIFTPSSVLSRKSSATVEFLNPYNFGAECLQSCNNGLLGIQSFANVNDQAIYTSDLRLNPLDPLLISTMGQMPVEHAFSNGGRPEYRTSGPLVSDVSTASCDPMSSALPENLTPASSPSSISDSSLSPMNWNCSESVSGWLFPLHIAAQNGHDGIVRVLLQHNIDCNEPDSDGLTPLIHATVGGYEDVIESLLSYGAQVDKVDSQRRTVLHWAVICKREAVLKTLLDHSMGDQKLVDSYDSEERTPLHAAIEAGFEGGVQVLLQYGANLHFRAGKK
jgi:hypothetical protein